ncbi:zinc-binding A33-like protein [Labeo rohita]|uniref:RING-type E3 ubiquitin transferase n=1 Tax=Labeo rohita TaxID=84645 RepID=A0A498N7J0_LABRO|nr:zinc-binding A33-like protein [Labeo rohita]
MDSRLSKQIQCSVCLGDFTDPVSLLCDHTFCRQCISNHSQSCRLKLCPECRRPYTMWDIRSNRVLRNMVTAVREHLSEQQALRDMNVATCGASARVFEEPEKLVCSDHQERLKLFCETDQKLVCLICRDGERHQGHTFKPVEEAAEPRKWWTEKGLDFVEEMKEKESCCENNDVASPTTKFKSAVKSVNLTPNSLLLGLHETHLQFIVWKEMLGFIKPVPDRNVIHDCHDPYLRVSSDGRSVIRTSKKGIFLRHKDYRPLARTHKTFQSGQHYWEVDVGAKIDWSVGFDGGCISNLNKDIGLHLKHDQGYCIKEYETVTEIDLTVKPRRIGLYLDCDRCQVCFYNADDMTLLHTSTYPSPIPYSLSLSPGAYLAGKNADPLTVTWN